MIHNIRKLPQGGTEVVIEGKNGIIEACYVPAGFLVNVKLGDEVESGDVLSEGIVNPADIVHHKGIGEGRRYFTENMGKAFEEAGMGVNRRNFEVIAKAAVDHVRVTHPDGLGDHLHDSIASYQSIEKDYKPRHDSQHLRVDLARGKYLEAPVLHYTIGTKISKSMIDSLKKHNIQSVHVHNMQPGFHPEMQRLLDVPGHVPDWAHQLYSTYLEKKLINGVNEGLTSNLKGPSPILGLSFGVGFGLPEKHSEEEDLED